MRNIKTIKFNYNGISLVNIISNEIQSVLLKYIGNIINIHTIQDMKNELNNLLCKFDYVEYYNIKESTYNIIVEYKIYNYDELISLDIGLK